MIRSAGVRRTALLCSTIAFAVTSALALFAADWPPPPGFLWLEALLAALAVIVYFRVRSRLAARSRGRRIPVAALEGALASLAAGFALLTFNVGDPDVTLSPRDHMVWIAAVGLAGAAAAQALWGLAIRVDRAFRSPTPLDDTKASQ